MPKYLMFSPGLCVQPTMEKPDSIDILIDALSASELVSKRVLEWESHIRSLPQLPTTCTLKEGEWFEGREQSEYYERVESSGSCEEVSGGFKTIIVPVEQKDEPIVPNDSGPVASHSSTSGNSDELFKEFSERLFFKHFHHGEDLGALVTLGDAIETLYGLLNSEQNPERSVASKADSSTDAGKQKDETEYLLSGERLLESKGQVEPKDRPIYIDDEFPGYKIDLGGVKESLGSILRFKEPLLTECLKSVGYWACHLVKKTLESKVEPQPQKTDELPKHLKSIWHFCQNALKRENDENAIGGMMADVACIMGVIVEWEAEINAPKTYSEPPKVEPQPKKEEGFWIYDTIDGEMIETDDPVAEIKARYTEPGEGAHPDFYSFDVFKKVGTVDAVINEQDYLTGIEFNRSQPKTYSEPPKVEPQPAPKEDVMNFYVKFAALIQAYENYRMLLTKEIDELVGLAQVHGWKSSRHEKGEELRKAIAEAKAAIVPSSKLFTESEVRELMYIAWEGANYYRRSRHLNLTHTQTRKPL